MKAKWIAIAVSFGLIGLIIAAIVHSFPLIDRMIRPCAYYPEMFIDCRE